MILAIDPGKHSGWACFSEGLLVGCAKFDPEKTTFPQTGFRGFDEVVIELPVSRGGKTLASADSLITLGIRAGIVKGACIERGFATRMVETVKWSGTMPKCKTQKEHLTVVDVRHRRIVACLNILERGMVEMTKSSDVWDAVGLGLWACGRF